MLINWPSLTLGASPLIAGLVLRFLLDMHIWPGLVKALNWIPVRGVFRSKPPDLRGDWDVFWEANTVNFPSERDRHQTATIYQLDGYCYASYYAKQQRYCMIGKIDGSFLTGIWYNIKDPNSYRGSFQLRIVSQRKLTGRWLGFSTSSLEINTGIYDWSKQSA